MVSKAGRASASNQSLQVAPQPGASAARRRAASPPKGGSSGAWKARGAGVAPPGAPLLLVALAATGGAAGSGRQCWAAEVGEMCRLLRQDTSVLRGHLPERMDIGEFCCLAALRSL